MMQRLQMENLLPRSKVQGSCVSIKVCHLGRNLVLQFVMCIMYDLFLHTRRHDGDVVLHNLSIYSS